MKRRSLITALLIALAGQAMAGSNQKLCDDLRAKLADLPEIIGTSPNARHYASALNLQKRELGRLRSDMRDNGCGQSSIVIVGRDSNNDCAALEQTETQMLDRLRSLEDEQANTRNRAGGGQQEARRQLEAALSDNGCDGDSFRDPDGMADSEGQYAPAPPAQEQAMRSGSFISPDGSAAAGSGSRLPAPGMIARINTICVRTCDGGFFPVTSNASTMDFSRDGETCAKMCPGIPTELFYQDVGNGDASAMVSTRTGAPYSALPNAFAYKNRKPGEKSACACDLSGYYDKMRKGTPVAREQQGSVINLGTAPEKPAVTAPLPSGAAPALPDRDYDPDKAPVRKVGPQFFAGDQNGLDLKNPIQSGPQPRQ